MKWPLLPKSSLEQKHANSQQQERAGGVEKGDGGGCGGGREMRQGELWPSSEGSHVETERFISSVTSVGWLVTRVRCGRALGSGQGEEGVKSDQGGMR